MDDHELALDLIPEGLLSIRDHLRAARKEVNHLQKCGHRTRELSRVEDHLDEALMWLKADGSDARWKE